MTEQQFMILEHLKDNAQGKKNAILGKELAELFNMGKSRLRFQIKKIKLAQDIIIGSDIKYGYYIPNKGELKEALRYRQNKALSELTGCIKEDPSFILKVFKSLNITKVDDATQGQLRFNYDRYDLESVDFLNANKK